MPRSAFELVRKTINWTERKIERKREKERDNDKKRKIMEKTERDTVRTRRVWKIINRITYGSHVKLWSDWPWTESNWLPFEILRIYFTLLLFPFFFFFFIQNPRSRVFVIYMCIFFKLFFWYEWSSVIQFYLYPEGKIKKINVNQ